MEEEQLTSTTSSLSRGNKGWIRAIIAFVKHHQLQSEEEFKDTSINEFNKVRLTATAYSCPSNSPNDNKSNSKHKVEDNTLASFKRAIKKYRSQYNVLCDEKQWESWNRSTKATECVHHCEEVFNETYVPNRSEEKQLFLK